MFACRSSECSVVYRSARSSRSVQRPADLALGNHLQLERGGHGLLQCSDMREAPALGRSGARLLWCLLCRARTPRFLAALLDIIAVGRSGNRQFWCLACLLGSPCLCVAISFAGCCVLALFVIRCTSSLVFVLLAFSHTWGCSGVLPMNGARRLVLSVVRIR